MLVLGFCLKPNSDEACKTDKIVKALEMGGGNPVLFLDLRNECRRSYDKTGCKSISEKESEVLLASKALESRSPFRNSTSPSLDFSHFSHVRIITAGTESQTPFGSILLRITMRLGMFPGCSTQH